MEWLTRVANLYLRASKKISRASHQALLFGPTRKKSPRQKSRTLRSTANEGEVGAQGNTPN